VLKKVQLNKICPRNVNAFGLLLWRRTELFPICSFELQSLVNRKVLRTDFEHTSFWQLDGFLFWFVHSLVSCKSQGDQMFAGYWWLFPARWKRALMEKLMEGNKKVISWGFTFSWMKHYYVFALKERCFFRLKKQRRLPFHLDSFRKVLVHVFTFWFFSVSLYRKRLLCQMGFFPNWFFLWSMFLFLLPMSKSHKSIQAQKKSISGRSFYSFSFVSF